MHVASSLPSAQWYRAAFKFSSGQVMPVGSPSFYLHCLTHAHAVSSVYAHRLDLQHRWRAGRRRQDSIRRISPIQLTVASAVHRQRCAVRHIQDCWQTLVPERVQSWPRNPCVSACRCSAGVQTDYKSAAAELYIVASSEDWVTALHSVAACDVCFRRHW
jgi:hypothetical protein